MDNILIHPTYFPSISHYVAMAQAGSVTFEVEDNFQKQTNRNRMYIYSPNGVQLLNIPLKHNPEKGHQKFKDTKIEQAFDWQKQHFKSLESRLTALRPSSSILKTIYALYSRKKHTYMMDLNFQIMEILAQMP